MTAEPPPRFTVPSGELTRRLGDVALRRPDPGDLDVLHAINADPDSWRHFPRGRHTTRRQTEALLATLDDHWATHGWGPWSVVLDGVVVGTAGVTLRDTPPGRRIDPVSGADVAWPSTDGSAWWLNLGYRLATDVHGRGLGRRVAVETVAFATHWLAGPPLLAYLRPVNTASLRTAEAAGLTVVGAIDDVDGDEPSLLLELVRPR